MSILLVLRLAGALVVTASLAYVIAGRIARVTQQLESEVADEKAHNELDGWP